MTDRSNVCKCGHPEYEHCSCGKPCFCTVDPFCKCKVFTPYKNLEIENQKDEHSARVALVLEGYKVFAGISDPDPVKVQDLVAKRIQDAEASLAIQTQLLREIAEGLEIIMKIYEDTGEGFMNRMESKAGELHTKVAAHLERKLLPPCECGHTETEHYLPVKGLTRPCKKNECKRECEDYKEQK